MFRILLRPGWTLVQEPLGCRFRLAGNDRHRSSHDRPSYGASETVNRSAYGNGASIFTRSGKAAREFKHRVKTGVIGINIGVPASMAWFPFSGWSDSFFGELHMQGKEGVQFFTEQKVITSRWFGEEDRI